MATAAGPQGASAGAGKQGGAAARQQAAAKFAADDAVVELGQPFPPAREGRLRTASWRDAAYHSVTAMVGAGVLGLPSTFVPLGWAGGLVVLLFSFWVSWYTYKQLVLMHEHPDPKAPASGGDSCADDAGDGEAGWVRYDRYQDLTIRAFGPRAGRWALLPFQAAVIIGISITYTVVGGDDLRAIVADYAPASTPPHSAVLLSQLPEYTHLGWVSAFGALMSIGYCAIATGLAAAYRVQGGGPAASYVSSTLTEPSPVKRVINIFAAMSTVLFAYGGHNIALEIQATLPRPPTVQRMMRGVNIAFVITGVLYFSVAISGYAATGAATGDNIVLSLSNGPAWLRALARAMVVVHVLAAYQVYTHPVFDWVESAAGRAAARAGCAPLASAFSYGSWPSRLLLRTAHVGFTTLVAIIIPFFGELMALIGAVAITPTTYFLPPLLWLILNKPHRFGLEWWVNICLVAVTGVIGLMGTISATWLIVSHATTYQFFAQ